MAVNISRTAPTTSRCAVRVFRSITRSGLKPSPSKAKKRIAAIASSAFRRCPDGRKRSKAEFLRRPFARTDSLDKWFSGARHAIRRQVLPSILRRQSTSAFVRVFAPRRIVGTGPRLSGMGTTRCSLDALYTSGFRSAKRQPFLVHEKLRTGKLKRSSATRSGRVTDTRRRPSWQLWKHNVREAAVHLRGPLAAPRGQYMC